MNNTGGNQPNASLALDSFMPLTNAELIERIRSVKTELGSRLLILAHHYQRDEIVDLSDLRGDSYQLSQAAAADEQCEAIVFCGVHFMAETADILANRPEQVARRGGRRVSVVLPELSAGCSLADMARADQLENCWAELGEIIDVEEITPITYVNSTAAIKAFCGRRGGIVCTSSNAAAVLQWALARRPRVLFLPDQHLGRNTAVKMGIPPGEMPLWNPQADLLGGNGEESLRRAKIILWRGHCCVHQIFRPEDLDRVRRADPDVKVIVHPECPIEVTGQADYAGSTGMIINTIADSPPGSHWAVGTEMNLVNRLRRQFPDKTIEFLSQSVGVCPTMYLIDLVRLSWSLENLRAGKAVNAIRVDEETARWALVALERMLEVR